MIAFFLNGARAGKLEQVKPETMRIEIPILGNATQMFESQIRPLTASTLNYSCVFRNQDNSVALFAVDDAPRTQIDGLEALIHFAVIMQDTKRLTEFAMQIARL